MKVLKFDLKDNGKRFKLLNATKVALGISVTQTTNGAAISKHIRMQEFHIREITIPPCVMGTELLTVTTFRQFFRISMPM